MLKQTRSSLWSSYIVLLRLADCAYYVIYVVCFFTSFSVFFIQWLLYVQFRDLWPKLQIRNVLFSPCNKLIWMTTPSLIVQETLGWLPYEYILELVNAWEHYIPVMANQIQRTHFKSTNNNKRSMSTFLFFFVNSRTMDKYYGMGWIQEVFWLDENMYYS